MIVVHVCHWIVLAGRVEVTKGIHTELLMHGCSNWHILLRIMAETVLIELCLHWIVELLLLILGHGIPLILLLTIEVHAHALIAAIQLDLTVRMLGVGRDYLNVSMAWQKFHIGRAVEKHLTGNRRQWICQISQLIVTMGEAAVVLKLAHASLLEVATDLSLVV